MRLSRYFLPVLKETPAEAQIVSHRLMLRAGMIRQAAAGIYSWLPLGWRVLRRIEAIVHEEQQRAGHIPLLDAHPAARRTVARKRPLRRLRRRDAAHPRPAWPRHALRADQRRADHRHLSRPCRQLQATCR
jgi:hypothetical protein